MAGSASKKNRTKRRKQKKKDFSQHSAQQARREKAEFYFEGARYYKDIGNYDKAEAFLKKALKRDPDNKEGLFELIRLGDTAEKDELIRNGLLLLHERGLLENTPVDNKLLLGLCRYLIDAGEFLRAKQISEELLARRKSLKLENPKDFEKGLNQVISYSQAMLEYQESASSRRVKSQTPDKRKSETGTAPRSALESGRKTTPPQKEFEEPAKSGETAPAAREAVPEIPITLEIGEKDIAKGFAEAAPASREHYDLVMDAVRLRFKETFDHLLCLSTLNSITSLEYQEETARKVLKTFRGRALLADEVGMGKT
ncbi:MAG: tetratricopeptide repeat protein, partial [Desulfobacterales bacterium]